MKKWVCLSRPPFSVQKTRPLKPVRNFGGVLVKSRGPKKGVRGNPGGRKSGKRGKRSKIPPAKTPYDAKSGFVNAVRGKKGGFWCFLGFRGVFFGGFLCFSGRVGSARSQLFMPGLHHAHTLQHTKERKSIAEYFGDRSFWFV